MNPTRNNLRICGEKSRNLLSRFEQQSSNHSHDLDIVGRSSVELRESDQMHRYANIAVIAEPSISFAWHSHCLISRSSSPVPYHRQPFRLMMSPTSILVMILRHAGRPILSLRLLPCLAVTSRGRGQYPHFTLFNCDNQISFPPLFERVVVCRQ